METHTPGEWSCDYGDFCVFSDRGGEIAEITAGRNDDGSTIGAREMEANMRLIAAAPELLAQLKMAAEFISGHNECLSAPSGSGDKEWNDYCIGLLEDCKAAVAKAEGRPE